VIFTSDHGHSIGDRNHLGKRGYPAFPEVFDVPLMIRFPEAEHAGATSETFVQHHDIAAAILEVAGVEPPAEIEGRSFFEAAVDGRPGHRDHVTVAWGSAVTAITGRWWFNAKVDGTGVLLYDLKADDPFAQNVADEHPDAVNDLFAQAVEDAGGGFPDWLLELARNQADAPGCSALVARA
jgi:arylsulfatase A-like enzyme